MREWVSDVFGIEKDIDGNDSFVFEVDKEIEVNLNIFLMLFGEVEAPPSYDNLIKVAEQKSLAWIEYFDSWKEQGILN